MQSRTKRLSRNGAGIILACAFLFMAFRKIDMAELRRHCMAVNPQYLPLFLIAFAAFFWLKAIRWSWLLRPVRRLSAQQVLPALMVGFMGNELLPAHLGELIRVLVLGKQYHLRSVAVLSTIVLERVFDFLTIIGMFAVTLLFIPLPAELGIIRAAGWVTGVGSLALLMLAVVSTWQTQVTLRLVERAARVLPTHLRGRTVETMRLVVQGLSALRDPRLFAGIGIVTLLHWGVHAWALYLAIVSFPLSSPLPVLAVMLLMAVMALAAALPSGPGSIGTMQYCFVLTLGVFGISSEAALAGSLYMFVAGFVPVMLAGLWGLARLKMTFGALRADASRQERQRNDPHW